MKIQPKSKYKYTIKRQNNPFTLRWNGIPAIKRKTIQEKSLSESIYVSVFGHILSFVLIWLIAFLLLYFGIAPAIFNKPKPKIQNIEFKLNNRIWKKPVKAKKISTITNSETSLKSKEPKEKPQSEFSNIFNKITHQKAGSNHIDSKAGKASKHSVIPEFAMPMSNVKSVSSGLGGGSGKGKHHAAGFSNSNSLLNDNQGVSASGKSSGSGFNKVATKKMISTYDISPYVNELKRNIRWHWKSPNAEGNKRVELFLRIAKDGRVVILNVKRTSENGAVDEAALSAVRNCMPLNPLPSQYHKNYLDVVFTFDSNYVGSRF